MRSILASGVLNDADTAMLVGAFPFTTEAASVHHRAEEAGTAFVVIVGKHRRVAMAVAVLAGWGFLVPVAGLAGFIIFVHLSLPLRLVGLHRLRLRLRAI